MDNKAIIILVIVVAVLIGIGRHAEVWLFRTITWTGSGVAIAVLLGCAIWAQRRWLERKGGPGWGPLRTTT